MLPELPCIISTLCAWIALLIFFSSSRKKEKEDKEEQEENESEEERLNIGPTPKLPNLAANTNDQQPTTNTNTNDHTNDHNTNNNNTQRLMAGLLARWWASP